MPSDPKEALERLDADVLQLHDWIAEETRHTPKIAFAGTVLERVRVVISERDALAAEVERLTVIASSREEWATASDEAARDFEAKAASVEAKLSALEAGLLEIAIGKVFHNHGAEAATAGDLMKIARALLDPIVPVKNNI